jgi:hypothetical protein
MRLSFKSLHICPVMNLYYYFYFFLYSIRTLTDKYNLFLQALETERTKKTQWSKKRDKQTTNDLWNAIQLTKDRATRTPINSGRRVSELRCCKRVGSICPSSGFHCVDLVTIPMISHEYIMDQILLTTSRTHSQSYVTKLCQ